MHIALDFTVSEFSSAGDGAITEDEFVGGCKSDGSFLKVTLSHQHKEDIFVQIIDLVWNWHLRCKLSWEVCINLAQDKTNINERFFLFHFFFSQVMDDLCLDFLWSANPWHSTYSRWKNSLVIFQHSNLTRHDTPPPQDEEKKLPCDISLNLTTLSNWTRH